MKLNTFRGIPHLLVAALMAAISASMLASASAVPDNCIGCSIRQDDMEDSMSATCNYGSYMACTVQVWSEVSDQEETCGDSGVACNKAKCSFTFAIKYSQSGGCSSSDWVVTPTVPPGSGVGIPAGADGELDDFGKAWNKTCGVNEQFEFKLTSATCTSVNETIAGTYGCNECSPIP